jgi:uncharacterized protein (TIGR03437 family)
MVIYGTNLAVATASATTLPLPKRLLGTSVTVDGHAAALLYVSATQVNALIPFDVAASRGQKSPCGADRRFRRDELFHLR